MFELSFFHLGLEAGDLSVFLHQLYFVLDREGGTNSMVSPYSCMAV